MILLRFVFFFNFDVFQQTLQTNRHEVDRIQHKKTQIQQMIDDRNESIDQILTFATEINAKVTKNISTTTKMFVFQKIDELKNEIIRTRRQRDVNEMQQMRLRRTLKNLEKIENFPSNENRRILIDEVKAKRRRNSKFEMVFVFSTKIV